MEYEIGPDEPVSEAVIRAVSALEGCEPPSLRPLDSVLDADAMDALFAPRSDGTTRRGGTLSFVFSHCRVTVENGEFLTVVSLEYDQLLFGACEGD